MADGQQTSSIDYVGILSTILELVVLHLRFWFTCLESMIRSLLPSQLQAVKGENVLITGTGHGIGKQLALQYGKLGANVICWDINEKNNNETVKQIKAEGGQAFAYKCNVMDREEINALAEKNKKQHGFIGVIVNNAGIMPCHPLLQTTETEIRNMFEINVLAHFWIIQAFLPEMLERNQGNIVALSSCAGLFGLPNLVPYCGTKFAVRGLMQALTEELRQINPSNNIKLTSIYPYMVDTGLCKKPRYRFPKLMKLVDPKDAAASIISAQRAGLEEASIPRHFVYVDKIGRLIPRKAMRLINDFLDTGVDSDM